MKLLSFLSKYFVLFQPAPSLQEVIAHELELEVKDAMTCDGIILIYRFKRHMAQAKIKAMQEWLNNA